jgi:uncharacterized protein YdeI (YjbR/CyaY-like superfamily)
MEIARMTRAPTNSVHPKSRAEWRAWLAEHHSSRTGVWLVTYKKATGKPRVEYEESVEEALCFGWIDSKANKLDEERSLLWFAPRKLRTGWSAPNKARVERLAEAGLMSPAGQAKVIAAKADGSWSSLDAVEALVVPEDLARALAGFPLAEERFNAFPRSVKRGILEWICSARKPDTRASRVAQTARLANENQRANQWRNKQNAA